MPRIWSGSLTFSLVTIPVTVEAATSSHKIGFRQVHTEDMGRVKYRKTCELDEQVLTPEDIGRAYEAPDGSLVVVSDAELDELPLPTVKTIEVSGFVELAAVPPEQFDKPYFLAPSSPAANKPYALMRDALAGSGKAAVGKLAMRGSERLALVHARGDVLVLQTLHWNDELRSSEDAAPRQGVELSREELAGAQALIESMSGISIGDFHDEYSEAVEAVIAAKIEGAEPPAAPAAGKDKGDTLDLMSALAASVDKARTSRSDTGSDGDSDSDEGSGGGRTAEVTHLHERRSEKAAAKKAAAKKASPKKSAAKKTTTGKSAAKKSAAKKAPAERTTTRRKRTG